MSRKNRNHAVTAQLPPKATPVPPEPALMDPEQTDPDFEVQEAPVEHFTEVTTHHPTHHSDPSVRVFRATQDEVGNFTSVPELVHEVLASELDMWMRAYLEEFGAQYTGWTLFTMGLNAMVYLKPTVVVNGG